MATGCCADRLRHRGFVDQPARYPAGGASPPFLAEGFAGANDGLFQSTTGSRSTPRDAPARLPTTARCSACPEHRRGTVAVFLLGARAPAHRVRARRQPRRDCTGLAGRSVAPTDRMDGRPHPPPRRVPGPASLRRVARLDARLTTTHLKWGWIRRNGVPSSDQATVVTYYTRNENVLTIARSGTTQF